MTLRPTHMVRVDPIRKGAADGAAFGRYPAQALAVALALEEPLACMLDETPVPEHLV